LGAVPATAGAAEREYAFAGVDVAAFFGAIPVGPVFLRLDLWVMLGASLLMAPFDNQHVDLTRDIGAAFTVAYGLYILVILS